MSGLNDYLKENYMSYIKAGGFLDFDIILQIIKDLEGEKEELRKDLESRNNRIETLLHHRKYLEEKNQDIREENERLKEKNKELKNLVDSYSDNVKCYERLLEDNNRASAGDVLRTFLVGSIIHQVEEKEENETMRDPEDESDVGKQLFSVKAKIKHYETDTNEYHFTNETKFVMAKGWANAVEVFLRNTCLHISEEIIEIEISHKPHIE